MDDVNKVEMTPDDTPRHDNHDLTVRIQGHEFEAHKQKLAENSYYFDNLFKDKAKKGSFNSIELHGDDPTALEGLIAQLYGWYYDGRDDYCTERMAEYDQLKNNTFAEFMIYRANLYIVALKYRVTWVWVEVLQELVGMLTKATEKKGYPTDLDKVTRHVFLACTSAPPELCAIVRNVWLSDMDRFKYMPEFEALTRDIPALVTGMDYAHAHADRS